MWSQHIIDATGILALSLNVSALLRPSDRTLLKTSGWASALWTLNNLLMGALTAAALSALSVGRQMSAAALHDRPRRSKATALAIVVIATLLIAGLTWNGMHTLFPVAGSLVGTYAMFCMRGASLRLALVLVNGLWMHNALAYDSVWQIAANGLSGAAAAIGAWRTRTA